MCAEVMAAAPHSQSIYLDASGGQNCSDSGSSCRTTLSGNPASNGLRQPRLRRCVGTVTDSIVATGVTLAAALASLFAANNCLIGAANCSLK